jgi:hypothetical protein
VDPRDSVLDIRGHDSCGGFGGAALANDRFFRPESSAATGVAGARPAWCGEARESLARIVGAALVSSMVPPGEAVVGNNRCRWPCVGWHTDGDPPLLAFHGCVPAMSRATANHVAILAGGMPAPRGRVDHAAQRELGDHRPVNPRLGGAWPADRRGRAGPPPGSEAKSAAADRVWSVDALRRSTMHGEPPDWSCERPGRR